jgi:hypothetical protein
MGCENSQVAEVPKSWHRLPRRELKATQALLPAHGVQSVNSLTATGIDVGLLLNFGGQSLAFKRKSRQYRPSAPTPRDENADCGGQFSL